MVREGDRPFERPDAPGVPRLEQLTEEQRDGRACVRCGRGRGPMVPVGTISGCQVFGCEDTIACAAAAEQLPPGEGT